jgi:hypothetical protein
VKRANDGRAAARKRGVHMGRKPKLTELQRRVARGAGGEISDRKSAASPARCPFAHKLVNWLEEPVEFVDHNSAGRMASIQVP